MWFPFMIVEIVENSGWKIKNFHNLSLDQESFFLLFYLCIYLFFNLFIYLFFFFYTSYTYGTRRLGGGSL